MVIQSFTVTILSLLPLGLLRIIRSWNQTGQKRAGSPDIAKHILPPHCYILWTLIFVTYFDITVQVARHAVPWASRKVLSLAAIFLGAIAFVFKVTFTVQDAPELLVGFELVLPHLKDGSSLVLQARLIYTLAFALAFATFANAIPTALQPDTRTSEKIEIL